MDNAKTPKLTFDSNVISFRKKEDSKDVMIIQDFNEFYIVPCIGIPGKDPNTGKQVWAFPQISELFYCKEDAVAFAKSQGWNATHIRDINKKEMPVALES